MVYKKAHLNLIRYALDKGCSLSVDSEGDVLLQASTSFNEIKEAVECVDESHLYIFDGKCNRIGVAFVVLGNADDELVCDHSDNDFMNTWFNLFDETAA